MDRDRVDIRCPVDQKDKVLGLHVFWMLEDCVPGWAG